MASFKLNDDARRNRAASMTDSRPDVDISPAPGRPGQFQGRTQLRDACLIRVDRIQSDPDQPRAEFDAESLARLAASLKSRGQLQPIRVRWEESRGVYVVVVGERRWRAAKLAGLESIACVVVPGTATPEDILEDQLVENCLRDDLRPIEQARAYQSLMARGGLTTRELAERLQISIGQISMAVALLELPEPVKALVDRGDIAPTIAYELSKVDDPQRQVDLAAQAERGEIGRDQIREQTVRRPRPSKFTFRLDDGTSVMVTFPQPGATHAEAIQALKNVLQREGRKRGGSSSAA
jgi:ParB family chromosome partitioning protein